MFMDAKTYNNIRRIIFSTANNPKKGFGLARQYLENTYRAKLGQRSYVGLLAELKFYERHRKEFGLTVAGDMGEHADFAGVYDKGATRFDVTTNLEFKRFSTYEPFIGEGMRYQIALLDSTNFEIIDIIDLAFNRCKCGGYLLPFVTVFDLGGQSDNGYVMNVCSGCKSVVELDDNVRRTNMSLAEYVKSSLSTGFSSNKQSYDTYSVDQYKYLRNQHPEDNLMGIAFPHYLAGDPYAVELTFCNKVIDIDLSGELVIDNWVDDIANKEENANLWVDDFMQP